MFTASDKYRMSAFVGAVSITGRNMPLIRNSHLGTPVSSVIGNLATAKLYLLVTSLSVSIACAVCEASVEVGSFVDVTSSVAD